MPLVEGFENVHCIEHLPFIGTRQFLNQSLDGRKVCNSPACLSRPDLPSFDAATEGRLVPLPCPQSHEEPQGGNRDAGITQLPPAEAHTPGLNQDQQQHCRNPFCKPVDSHIHEGLGLELDAGRERHVEDLTRCLVDRVAQRLIQNAGQRRHPERGVKQNNNAGGAEAQGEQNQGKADPEVPMNTGRERQLYDKANDRGPELHAGKKSCNGIGGLCPLRGFNRHVQLLLYYHGTDGRKTDHKSNALEVPGLAKQLESPLSPDSSFPSRHQECLLIQRLFRNDEGDQHHADHHEGRAVRQKVDRPDPCCISHEEDGPGDAPKRGSRSNESEQAFGLAWIIDHVGKGPELADEQDAQHQAENIKSD
jgi:hypothetical protein